MDLLDERDRGLRGRAAAMLARLAESRPGRLIRSLERLREALTDDSAYVRWHVAYSLGRMGARFPAQAPHFLSELVGRLDDENRMVKIFAGRALASVAEREPQIVEQAFETAKRAIPPALGRVLHKFKKHSRP